MPRNGTATAVGVSVIGAAIVTGDRGGVYVGPTYGYYDYGYPPPPVYYPQPGFSINIPLDIR